MARQFRHLLSFIVVIAALIVAYQPTAAQGNSTFTYQGYLTTASGPVTATCDLQFKLYDLAVNGAQIGPGLLRSGVTVTQGVFSVQLDFGGAAFNSTSRYLEIGVKCGAEPNYTALSPRQILTVAPYALTAFNNWSLVGNAGTNPGSQFIGTTDNQPFEVRVNNIRVLRLEPKPDTVAGTAPNVIAGSPINRVNAGVHGATIGGGGGTTTLAYQNFVGGNFGTVSGGIGNFANGASSTISGGQSNTTSNALGTIGGGYSNDATGYISTISGGDTNVANGFYSAISGGQYNTTNGDYSIVGGGLNNIASGTFSFAAGRGANADDEGAFVWADGQGIELPSPGVNTFTVRAGGGVWLGTGAAPATFTAGRFIDTSTGGYLTSGGAWTNSSDRALKANFTPINSRTILEAVAKMPLTTWNYTAEGDTIKHLGPTAQDFRAAFGLGADDTSISTVDAAGVALAAIQALKAENDALRVDVALLKLVAGDSLLLPALIVSLAILGAALILRRR